METIDQNGVSVIMLTPQEVKARIDAGTAYVVDVREAHEHDEIRIADSDLAPLSTFDPEQIQVPDGKELILHCRSARRCGLAAEQLIEAGFKPKIHRMAGGMIRWNDENLPVETGPRD